MKKILATLCLMISFASYTQIDEVNFVDKETTPIMVDNNNQQEINLNLSKGTNILDNSRQVVGGVVISF